MSDFNPLGFLPFAVAILFMFLILSADPDAEAVCPSCDWEGEWEECVQKTIVKIENRTDPLWGDVYQVESIYTEYSCPDCGEILKEEFVSETRKL